MSNSGGAVVAMAASRRAERKVVEALRAQGATHPGGAAPLAVRGMSARAMRRLARGRVIHAVTSGGAEIWWLDEAAYEQFRSDRRSRALLMVLAVLVVIALIAAAQLSQIRV